MAERALTPEEFRDVIGHFATGVTVIATSHEGKSYGTTASAVCSLALEPPMLLICLNLDSSTGKAVTAAESFSVNILREDQGELAKHFARKDPDKFDSADVVTGAAGQPLLEAAVAHLECRVTERVTAATHVVFIAEVVTASAPGGDPLAYFRGEFGRFAPH